MALNNFIWIRCCVGLSLFASGLHAELQITPSKRVAAAAGEALQFKANAPVVWSLLRGSAGSIDANGMYHVPASIPVSDSLAGCQLLPNDHVLNTRIDLLPVHSKSAEWMTRIPVEGLHFSPSWGINIADNNTPWQALHFLYTPDDDGKFQIPLWPNLKRESGVFSDPTSGADRHIVTINRETCVVYEIYNNYDAGVNTQCPACTAQSGVAYPASTYALPSASTDAAGLFLAPLTLRLDEIQAGSIGHALRFTLKNNYVSPSSAWPSTSHAGAWGFIPYGTRFRLKSGYDISQFSPAAKVILTELKEYGAVLADGGLDWDIQTSTDVMEDYSVQSALAELATKGPRSNSLEAIDESALMLSNSSGQVNPQNRFVRPLFAIVVATQTSDPSKTAQVAIDLRGVTVGVPEPAIWIQSGVQKQMTAWVNGAANKDLHWSVNPPIGKVTSSGVFTAPKVDRPTTVNIVAASASSPDAKTSISTTIMPPGPIRINVGSASTVPGTPNKYAPDYGPDSEGHMWWRDQASESHGGATLRSSNGDRWPAKPDIALYYTARYAFGDMIYRFLVPNGNYKISLMIAHPECSGAFNPQNHAPVHFEAQGQMIFRNFDFGEPINHACLTPVVETMPASVTDNWLSFALRSGMDKNHLGNTLLNALIISPDPDPPHLAIAPETASLITGQQRQFYAVRWFTNGNVQWSLTGPGSLSPTGLYVAPPVPALSDRSVRIEARISGQSSISATNTFLLKAGNLVLSPSTDAIGRSLSKQLKATFGAVAYTNLTWSIAPQLGSISQAGLYTAPDNLPSNTNVTIRAQSNDDPSKSATAMLLIKSAVDPIRIRCGGAPGFTDARGNSWSSDYGYSSDTIANGDPVPIAGTTPDMQPLYQYARYRYQDQPFNYRFDVPDGRYSITLKFADYAHAESGHYSFDVGINGKKVISNFDPDQEHGPKFAVDRKFDVAVSNKQIKIDFLAHKDAAFINGIEIVYLGQ